MPSTVIEHAPQVRCYKCGSAEIDSVCHHCGKPMCKAHSPLAFRLAGKPAREPGPAAKLASQEFGGLGLDTNRAAVYHCEDHAHIVGGRGGLFALGVVLAVLGIIVLLFDFVPGLVLLLAGLVAAAIAIVRSRGASATEAPPLPVFPHVRAVNIVERLNGTVDLKTKEDTSSAGGVKGEITEEYTSSAGDVEGEITFAMAHSDWQEPLKQYRRNRRRKYRLSEDAPVKFEAGFAMLEGPSGLKFADGQPAVLEDGTGLRFGGDSIDHDLFTTAVGRREGDWNPSVSYGLQEDRKPEGIPLWIVPSLVPGSGQRTLQIDLHWNPLGSEGQGPDLELFDLIKLEVPASWGSMEGASPANAVTTAPAEGVKFREIDWQQLYPSDDEGTWTESEGIRRGNSRILTIQFEKPITKEPVLSGQVAATFNGTLSGLAGIGLYLPGGARDRKLEIKPKTRVTVDFTISLDAVRYQDDRVVPDENEDADKDRNRLAEFAGVVPDYGVVSELTNAISEEEFYVKSVIEHPPFVDDSRAYVLNRVWDIVGRYYQSVFPIDFNINLRGEEIAQDSPGVFSGKTVAQVMVKGAYARGGNADGALLAMIEGRWDALYGKVADVLGKRASRANGSWSVTARGEDAGPSDAIVLSEVIESPAIEPATELVAIEAGDIEVEVTGYSSNGGKASRVTELREQKKAAAEAVVAGRISEDTYREIVAMINAELRDLGELS
jgi:hypothetical protein